MLLYIISYISVITAIYMHSSWTCVIFRKIFRKLNEMYYLYPGAENRTRNSRR